MHEVEGMELHHAPGNVLGCLQHRSVVDSHPFLSSSGGGMIGQSPAGGGAPAHAQEHEGAHVEGVPEATTVAELQGGE